MLKASNSQDNQLLGNPELVPSKNIALPCLLIGLKVRATILVFVYYHSLGYYDTILKTVLSKTLIKGVRLMGHHNNGRNYMQLLGIIPALL